MFDAHLNFAIGTVLSAPADATGQDFTLMPGDGEAFAANMPVTMCPRDVRPNGNNSEIGYITAVDGDALTILRAQEGSLPMQVAANWQIFGSLTAKTVTDIEEAVADKASTENLEALESVVAGKADIANLEALDQVVTTKADKTELFSGDYIDLRGKPEFGTAALTDATDYATAEQGAKADTAVQPEAISNVDNTSDLNKPVSNATQAEFDNKADLVDGVIPTSQIPAIAMTNTEVVANEAAMLALTSAQVQIGDIAVRQDGAGTYILSANDPSQLSSWTRLNAPTDLVISVNGQVGTVLLGKADIGLQNVANLAPADMPVSTAQATALAAKANANATVNLTGDQDVGGRKTFTLLPVLTADPAAGNHATRKTYVDAVAAGKVNGTITIFKNLASDPPVGAQEGDLWVVR